MPLKCPHWELLCLPGQFLLPSLCLGPLPTPALLQPHWDCQGSEKNGGCLSPSLPSPPLVCNPGCSPPSPNRLCPTGSPPTHHDTQPLAGPRSARPAGTEPVALACPGYNPREGGGLGYAIGYCPVTHWASANQRHQRPAGCKRHRRRDELAPARGWMEPGWFRGTWHSGGKGKAAALGPRKESDKGTAPTLRLTRNGGQRYGQDARVERGWGGNGGGGVGVQGRGGWRWVEVQVRVVAEVCSPGPPGVLKGKESHAATQTSKSSAVWTPARVFPPTDTSPGVAAIRNGMIYLPTVVPCPSGLCLGSEK